MADIVRAHDFLECMTRLTAREDFAVLCTAPLRGPVRSLFDAAEAHADGHMNSAVASLTIQTAPQSGFNVSGPHAILSVLPDRSRVPAILLMAAALLLALFLLRRLKK